MTAAGGTKRVPGVLAVHRSGSHSFSKFAEDAVTLVPGLGIQGDAHCGATVKHRSRVAADPSQPNLLRAGTVEQQEVATKQVGVLPYSTYTSFRTYVVRPCSSDPVPMGLALHVTKKNGRIRTWLMDL